MKDFFSLILQDPQPSYLVVLPIWAFGGKTYHQSLLLLYYNDRQSLLYIFLFNTNKLNHYY